jgi:hypothetical protein
MLHLLIVPVAIAKILIADTGGTNSYMNGNQLLGDCENKDGYCLTECPT